MLSTSFGALMFSFGVMLVCIMVLMRRRDIIAIRFLFFSTSCCGWGFIYSVWGTGLFSAPETLAMTRVSHFFAVFIPITWLHFILEFLEMREPFKGFYEINYTFSLALFCSNATPYFISGVGPVMDYKYFTEHGPLYHFFTAYFFIIVGFGFFSLVKALNSASGSYKEQLKYLFIGALIGFVTGSGTFVPIYKINFPLEILLLMPFFPIFTGMAMMRFNLFDVEEMAQAAHRNKLAAIGTLAASINHEIKNPLYVIQGLAGAFIANRQDGVYTKTELALEKAEEIFSKISDHATRAMEIMKSFALFAKRNMAENDMKSNVHFVEIIRNVLPLVNHELEILRVRLIQNVPSDIPPIRANFRQMEEVMFNLIVNACQAFKEQNNPDPEIVISVKKYNNHIVIEIKDNGPGISENRLRYVFEPFYTSKDEGTGLGLYITRRLVENNCGRIKVFSKIQNGTAFLLEFKL